MLRIAVLGGRDTVMGFKALGLDVFPAAGPEEAKDIFRRLTRESEGEVRHIYVEENLAQHLEHEIARYKDVPSPAIILIPAGKAAWARPVRAEGGGREGRGNRHFVKKVCR